MLRPAPARRPKPHCALGLPSSSSRIGFHSLTHKRFTWAQPKQRVSTRVCRCAQTNDAIYHRLASRCLLQHMQSTGRTYVTLGLKQGACELGVLVIELCTDMCPKTCAHFLKLLQLPAGEGYLNTPIHRIVKSAFIQARHCCLSIARRMGVHHAAARRPLRSVTRPPPRPPLQESAQDSYSTVPYNKPAAASALQPPATPSCLLI